MGKLLATASITIKHVKDGQNGIDASNIQVKPLN